MAEYKRLPVPDYATGARNAVARNNDNLARLLQQKTTNAQYRVQNAQELSKGIQTLVNLSPTAAGMFKEQQLKADEKRQADYQVALKEAGITSQDYLKNLEDKKKLEDLGDEVDKMTYSLSAEKRDILNDIENPRDILWLKKHLAGEDMNNMPSAYIQAKDRATYNQLDTLARQNFDKQFELDYITNTSIGRLDAATRKELKIYDQFSTLFKNSTTTAAVTRTKLEKAERTTLYNKELDNTINAGTGLAAKTFIQNVNKKHLLYGGERKIYKNEDYNNLLIGIDNDTFTEDEIKILLESETGLDGFKTFRDYLGKEKAEGIEDALSKRSIKRHKENKERNKQINEEKETRISTWLVDNPGTTPEDQKIILDTAIHDLIKNGHNPENLERIRDNLDTGTLTIKAAERELETAYANNELTVEMVNKTGISYLMQEWTSKAEKQENGRKTDSYKNTLNTFENVFVSQAGIAYTNDKGLTPEAQGIVDKLKRDFNKEYIKLDPNDPNSAITAATIVTTDFKIKGGDTIDGPGLYSYNSKTGRFENYLKSIGADFSNNDIRKRNARNTIKSLTDQGLSRQAIVNNDEVLLNKDALASIEVEFEESGTWSPNIQFLSDELNVPPWIIYSGQGGKKIEETDAAKTWKKELSPKAKVSIMRDPSENTYTSIAYELSPEGIYDKDLNLSMFGIPNIPMRPGFNPFNP